jgi:hypothetical protein
MTDMIFSDLAEPQKGQGTIFPRSPNSSSSYTFPHSLHRYSNIGMSIGSLSLWVNLIVFLKILCCPAALSLCRFIYCLTAE